MYKTIVEENSESLKVKGSVFIGYVKHIESEKEAAEYLNTIRKKHYDASHHCYAFNVKKEKITRQSDDGEPSKTAGMPILDTITFSGLEDVMVIVVRYFGGTLLGTGGLVRAYSQCAKMTIDSAHTVSYSDCVDISLEIEYSDYDRIINCISSFRHKTINSEFAEKIRLVVRILSSDKLQAVKELETLLRGKTPSVSDIILDVL